jgi:hypothetical protein
MHNRMLLFGTTRLKHGRHFGYWNQHLNMRMRVCYQDFFILKEKCIYKEGLGHEAGLCCYLLIHIENLLRPLRLFYFHLWRTYWLSLVYWNKKYVTQRRERRVVSAQIQ